MDTVLLVDGSNLLFQMFYGMPARIPGKDGRPIHGTLGFVGALLRMIRMVGPTHAAVLLDGETHNPRTELDGEYKADRPDYSQLPPEEVPFSQLPDICRALDCLGIPHAETVCCETDDWMAAYARQLSDRCRVVIASFDSDLFQLIGENVSILRYRGDQTRIWDPAALREKLGVLPERYAAWKALTGDSSDNIRGVPGVGPKTAGALMAQFGTLEELLANTQAIARPSVRRAVEENVQRIRTNYALIRLDGEQSLPFSLEEMRFQDPGLTTGQVLSAIGVK